MSFEYSGDLLQPMTPPVIGPLMSAEQLANIAQEVTAEKIRRMDLLFDAHGVTAGDWVSLCFALATAHVPGFKTKKGRSGRPTKWDAIRLAELALAVDEIGSDVTAATTVLASQEPWKSLTRATRGAETLRDKYYEADRRVVEMLRKAKAFDALPEEEKQRACKLSLEY